MAFQLKRNRPIGAEIRRLLDRQLEHAIRELTHVGAGAGDRTIHAARRRVKKCRALLQLVAPEGPSRRVERQLRAVSRMLGPLADAEASARTFARLSTTAHRLPPAAGEVIGRLVAIRHDDTARAAVDVRARAARRLSAVRLDVEHCRVRGQGFGAITHGLRRGIRRGRRAMRDARERPDDGTFHRWRRRVKVQWLQLRLLDTRTAGALAAETRRLETLDGVLGEHHDVTLLQHTIAAAADLPRAYATAGLRLLRQRKAALRHRAIRLAAEIFDRRPRDVVRAYRKAWQA